MRNSVDLGSYSVATVTCILIASVKVLTITSLLWSCTANKSHHCYESSAIHI